MSKLGWVLGIGSLAAVGTAVAVIWNSNKVSAESGGGNTAGPYTFSVSTINLPAGTVAWDCSVQDTLTGNWYAATNIYDDGWISIGNMTGFSPSAVARFSIPISSGVLSIIAAEPGDNVGTDSSLALPTQLANFKINISVTDGAGYTVDCTAKTIS